jgi:drug/metabolite transporter (DMT)-like permease
MDNRKPLVAHASMLTAEVIWGLMSPIGKDAMTHGLNGLSLVSFRVAGAALLFWITSAFAKREHVPLHDILLFGAAAVLGIVFNQCLFTVGLSLTSPVNASIVTTSMPIFAMVISFFVLREPITWHKAGGVFIGCCGAVILILTSMTASSAKVGNMWGDLMCIGAQLSFASYLAIFNHLIKRYHVVTVNKWMFAWATVIVLPFTSTHLTALPWQQIATKTWLEVGYVVVFGTFMSYLLSIVSQRVLRPTVISVYNYVQPIVSVAVSVLTGLGVFTWQQGIAVILVFSGVWMVVKSKSRKDELSQHTK